MISVEHVLKAHNLKIKDGGFILLYTEPGYGMLRSDMMNPDSEITM